jgi:hypothetical protein
MNKVAILITVVLTVVLGFLALNHKKIVELEHEIADKQLEIDSIQKVSEGIIRLNDSLICEVEKIAYIKDSILKTIEGKEVKVVEHKELRDENSRVIYSSADSSITRFLTEHEFEAYSKR